MDNHIITLEQVCGSYKANIASACSLAFYKRLYIETSISPINYKVEYVVETKFVGVICRTENVDEAIKAYNDCQKPV